MLRRSLVLVTLIVFVSTVGQLAGPTPASAHASVAATEPSDGGTIQELPKRVVIRVIKKQATRAGDPIQVFGPDGTRVDTGDAIIGESGSVISVGLQPGAATTGAYNVLYQITSADTHIIQGRFGFTLAAAGAAGSGPDDAFIRSGESSARAATPARLRVVGAPAGTVAAGALLILAVAAFVLMVRRRRRHRTNEPLRPAFRVVSTGEHRLGPIPSAAPRPSEWPARRRPSGPRARSAS
jgi:copper transport protein